MDTQRKNHIAPDTDLRPAQHQTQHTGRHATDQRVADNIQQNFLYRHLSAAIFIDKHRQRDHCQHIDQRNCHGGNHSRHSFCLRPTQGGRQGHTDNGIVTAETALRHHASSLGHGGSDHRGDHADQKQDAQSHRAIDHDIPSNIGKAWNIIDIYQQHTGQAQLEHQLVSVL